MSFSWCENAPAKEDFVCYPFVSTGLVDLSNARFSYLSPNGNVCIMFLIQNSVDNICSLIFLMLLFLLTLPRAATCALCFWFKDTSSSQVNCPFHDIIFPLFISLFQSTQLKMNKRDRGKQLLPHNVFLISYCSYFVCIKEGTSPWTVRRDELSAW